MLDIHWGVATASFSPRKIVVSDHLLFSVGIPRFVTAPHPRLPNFTGMSALGGAPSQSRLSGDLMRKKLGNPWEEEWEWAEQRLRSLSIYSW